MEAFQLHVGPAGLILELLGDPRKSLGTLLEVVGDLSELLQPMVGEFSSWEGPLGAPLGWDGFC